MRERYAYVILACLSLGLAVLAIWISISHDRSDNHKFCEVAHGNIALIEHVLSHDSDEQAQLTTALINYRHLEITLGCTS